MIIAQQRRLYWGRSERFPSTDHLFPICVWSLNGLFTSRFLPSYLRLCEDVCMSLQGPASGNCALWYSTFSLCFFLFPLHKCFPLWHVVFICWTQESLSLRVICLSRPARVMFFKPGSGNLFQCVIQGYDIYPFSISTVGMFIILNVHLPVSLLFCIMEIISVYLPWRALWKRRREITRSWWSPARCETFFWGNERISGEHFHLALAGLTIHLFLE